MTSTFSPDDGSGYRPMAGWHWCVRCGALVRPDATVEHDEAHVRRDSRAAEG